jgi:hypothetical protein
MRRVVNSDAEINENKKIGINEDEDCPTLLL